VFPWSNTPVAAVELYKLEKNVTDTSTQVYSKLSNLDGLIRLTNGPDRNSLLPTCTLLQRSIESGISELSGLVRMIQSVKSEDSRTVQIQRGLTSYASGLLAQVKPRFGLLNQQFEGSVDAIHR
jgi:hypothetical protein